MLMLTSRDVESFGPTGKRSSLGSQFSLLSSSSLSQISSAVQFRWPVVECEFAGSATVFYERLAPYHLPLSHLSQPLTVRGIRVGVDSARVRFYDDDDDNRVGPAKY